MRAGAFGGLDLSVFGLHRFGSDIVRLVLVFGRYLLGYAVEFVVVFLLVYFFLLFSIHRITSWLSMGGNVGKYYNNDTNRF